MKILAPLAAVAAIAVSACTPGIPPEVEQAQPEPAQLISEAAARAVIAPLVAEQVPEGPMREVLTDCIVAAATPEEVITIGLANAGAPAPETVLLVSNILSRDEAVSCAAGRMAG